MARKREVIQRMRHTALHSTAAVLLWACAFGARPVLAAAPQTDHTQIVAALETMYAAFTADDLEKFRTVAASDFYAFDGGRRFTGDSLMELIKSLHAAGKVYVWRVTDPEVHVHGDMAWMTFVNRGSIRDASVTKDATWLESAVLRKEAAGWRIRFFHSTRVP